MIRRKQVFYQNGQALGAASNINYLALLNNLLLIVQFQIFKIFKMSENASVIFIFEKVSFLMMMLDLYPY